MSSDQGLVSIAPLSRRDAVRSIALAVTAAGLGRSIPAASAAEVHEEIEAERTFRGEYKVKYFTEHEFRTLERLSELVVPEDEGGPSGREGGAPEFIDLLSSQNEELAAIFTGGILWLDSASRDRGGGPFAEASEEQQTELLDAIVDAERDGTSDDTRWQSREYSRFSVFGLRRPSDLRRGLKFFGWARQLIVDAYYTSPAGIKDIGYIGSAAHTEYKVPREPLDFALARSPFDEV